MKTIVALYVNATKSHDVVRELIDKGYRDDEVSVISHHEAGELQDYVEDPTADDVARTTGEGEDVAAGAGIGALVGGLAGLLVGAGALVLPGVGPVIAAGTLAGALAGAGVGAVAGGLIGALVDAGIPEDEAEQYAEGVRRGGSLVLVHTSDDRADRAADILYRFAPIDIDEVSERWRDEGWEGFDEEAEAYTADDVARERALHAEPTSVRTVMEPASSVVVEDERADSEAEWEEDEGETDVEDYQPVGAEVAAERGGGVRVYGVET